MLDEADPILLRVMLSGDDFERVGDFVKAARAHPVGGIDYEALRHSAILLYARPYSNSKPKKKISGLGSPGLMVCLAP